MENMIQRNMGAMGNERDPVKNDIVISIHQLLGVLGIQDPAVLFAKEAQNKRTVHALALFIVSLYFTPIHG